MKTKKYLILVVVSLIAIAGPAIITGGTQKPSINKIEHRLHFLQGVHFAQNKIHASISVITLNRISPLDGIKEVVVSVEGLPQETERYGLTRQALQTDTELRLRQYGIKVMTIEEFKSKSEERRKESEKELNKKIIKQREYANRLNDLLDSGQYEKALNQLKEPEKSLIESLLNEESEERFMESVSEYMMLDIKHYIEQEAGPPALFINVLPLIYEERRTVIASVNVKLIDYIPLIRGSSRFLTEAVLWEKGGIIGRDLDDITEIRDYVRDYVDEFINDYLAANPTKAPQKGSISSIAISEDSSSAVIDDRIVHEGDTIGCVTVVKIYRDRVVFEKKGTEGTIRWTQKMGEAPIEYWE